jgi:hypothetical protein
MLYHIIKERVCYLEPEPQPLTEQQKQKILNKHLNALERLGYKFDVNTLASAALEMA